jgi:hypothetical protein
VPETGSHSIPFFGDENHGGWQNRLNNGVQIPVCSQIEAARKISELRVGNRWCTSDVNNGCFVSDLILSLLAGLCVFVRSRADLALEIVALRQQIAVLRRKRPRPQLNSRDRLFWTALRRLWPGWNQVLVIVKPDTVVGWHRAGFRWYWRWRSLRRFGRPRISEELRTLICRLARENPSWGAPKIHGELLKLGFDLCERTVARYLRRVRRRGDPAKNWLTFLENHREVIVALDFFTVPTITFQLLYFLFVIHHGRRRILHFNVTRHPTAEWTLQELREALPETMGCHLCHSRPRLEV